MGFGGGFAGGVTLTLSLAYLAVFTHQRNRAAQGDILRSQALILTALTRDPSAPGHALLPPPLPTRTELAAQERANLVEAAKDKWNAEIEGAARWIQTKDWTAAREDAEDAVRGLFGLPSVKKTVEDIKTGAASTAGSVSAAARSALEESKASAEKAAGGTQGFLAKGVEKGKEVLGKAKATVGLAEEKVEKQLDKAPSPASDVERALDERYNRKSDPLRQSVKDALNERYIPIPQRDNSKLRGV